MLHHVRGHLHHAPCVATRTHCTPLAQVRHQKVLAALLTARPRKPVQDYGLFVRGNTSIDNSVISATCSADKPFLSSRKSNAPAFE